MNDYFQMFMGFEGRLNRQPFWLGILGLIVASIILSIIFGILFGVSMLPSFGAMMSTEDPAALAQMAVDASRNGAWVSLILFLILAYPGLALWIKRAHDRNQNGNLVYAFYGILGVSYILQGLGMTMSVSDMGGIPMVTPNAFGMIISLAMFLLGLYLLVTLGFLKGTEGPNQYGPDPLGGSASQGAAA